MSSIPLPALGVKPPEQQNPLDQFARIQQIRGGQQQLQQGQIQTQMLQQQQHDQQAMTSAMQQWDGKDMNDLPKLIIKNGGSAQAVFGARKQLLDQQKMYSDIAASDATTGSKNLETLKGKNDLVAGKIGALASMPDEQLPGAIASTAQELAQTAGPDGKPLMDPQHAQALQQLSQSGDPNMIRQRLGLLQKTYMGQNAQIESAAKQAGITKDVAQANEANVSASVKQQELATGGTAAMADNRYRSIKQAQQLGRPVTAEDKAFLAAYEKQKTLVPTANFNLQNGGLNGGSGQPSAMAQMVASGQMKWGDVISPRTPASVKEAFAKEVKSINPNFNSGDFTVEQKAKEAFTSGTYSQNLNAINTAREHMKTFSSLADALDNGNIQQLNKLGNELGVQFGSDRATNFRLASQAFGGEVGKAFDGAGVTQGERAEAQKNFSENMSPAQFRGAIRTVDSLLAGKQKALQQTYQNSQQAKPNFGGDNSNKSDFFSQFGGTKR